MAVDAEPSNQQKSDVDKPSAPDATDNLPRLIVQRPSGDVAQPTVANRSTPAACVRYIPLALALVMTGGLVGLYFQPPGLQLLFRALGLTPGGGTTTPIAVAVDSPLAPKASDDPADAATIIGLGKLIPSGDVVVVAPPFGAGDARIAAIRIKEGDRVAKGDLLAVMDNEPQLRARIETSRAAIAAMSSSRYASGSPLSLMTALIGMTTVASAASTVRVVARPPLSLARSLLYIGVNK